MKDFDFDELDRAVNSVLAKKDSDPNTESNQDGSATATADAPLVQNDDTSASDQSTASPDATSVAVDDSASSDDASDNSSDAVAVNVNVESSPSQDESSDSTPSTDIQPETISDITPPTPEESQPQESPAASEEPVTVEQSVEEVHVEEDANPNNDEDSDSSESAEDADASQPDDSATSLASIPVKRGRFMDVVAPAGGEVKKTIPARGGVTLTPSPDFAAAEKEADQDASEAPSTTEPAPVEAEDVTAQDNQEAAASEEAPTTNDAPAEPTDAAPFIPDVDVEKRPLNPLTPDFQAPSDDTADADQSGPVEDQVSVDPTLSANVPKEFDKDVMAVEANETVGETDETHSDASTDDETKTESAPAVSESSNPATMAAATAEPHPMFDTSTLGHTGVVAHHSSKLTWVVVGVSLFVVGAALGVLYFLYGQA